MSEALINNMLKISGLPHRVINQIIQRADGNPFFIEEVVRSFIDVRAIVINSGKFIVTDRINETIVPHNINDVLIARIDRLDEITRDLVKVASVIKRSFFRRVLLGVTRTIEELDQRIEYLKDVQLIQEQRRMNEIEYLFKHALAQECAYESILPSKRRKLHEKVAHSIEKVFKDRLHKFYGMLAYHHSKGKNKDKAEKYLIMAGEEALKSSASNEAIHYYREALNFYLNNYADAENRKKVSMLERNIAIALSNKGHFIEALEYIDRTLASIGVYTPRNWFTLFWLTLFSFIKFLLGLYIPFFRFRKIPNYEDKKIIDLGYRKCEALALSSPKHFFCESINLLGTISKFKLERIERGSGIFAGSASIFNWTGISFGLSKKILSLCKERIDKDDIFSKFYYEVILLMHNFLVGDWQAIKPYDDSLEKIAIVKGQSAFLSIYIVWHGLLYIELGFFENSKKMIKKLSEISEVFEQDYAKILLYQLKCRLLIKTRELERSVILLNEGIKFLKNTDNKMYLNDFYVMKAQAQILMKDFNGAEHSVMLACNYLTTVELIPYFYTPFLMVKSSIELHRTKKKTVMGKNTELLEFKNCAFGSAKKALVLFKKSFYHRIEALKLMGNYYWNVNRQGKAVRCWNKSIAEGERIGARLELSRVYFEIGKRLSEPKSKFKQIKGITAEKYIDIAKDMFTKMDLNWDLKEVERATAYRQ